MFDIVCEVVEVTGNCDVKFKKGEKFVLSPDGNIDLKRSDKVCWWALSGLMPGLFPVQLGLDPKTLNMSNESGVAYMRCTDVGPPYTAGGNVLFRIKRLGDQPTYR